MKRFGVSWLGRGDAQNPGVAGWLLAGWRQTFPRRKLMLRASRSELKTAAAGLEEVARHLETRFLATSTALEKLAQHGDGFILLSEKLLNSATGRVGGTTLFLNAVKVIETPLGFLNDSHVKTCELLQRLKNTNDRIDEFINIQADLQRTIAPLKYIQTLFKIESAPLGENVQTMFGALTLEIEQLHDQVCELFTTKFHELREVQRTVNQVIGTLQGQTDSLWKIVSREKAEIDKSLEKLQLELLENQKREPRISRVGKDINADIQRVVTGLQFQDIINQKLQHTRAALAQIESLFEAGDGLSHLEQLCRLEAGQLQATRQDLASAETSIKMGGENVLGRLVKADSQCLTLAEFQQLTTSADGMVQVLFDVFETVRNQIGETVSSSSSAFEKLRPIGGLASGLTIVVRDLSQRIHLIGLNAQVQAAQVGNGGGLEVLSARTSEISRATTKISENVAEHLDQLVVGLAEGVKELEGLHAAAQEQQSALMATGAAAERSLHALRDEALTTLLNLNTLLDEIRSESQGLTHAVDFVDATDAPLAALQTELEHVAEVVSHLAKPGAANTQELVQQVHQSYTMDSERDVYASVVHGRTSEPKVAESTVELFDDFVSVLPAPPPAPSVSVPSAKPASTGRNAPPPDLGSNVELF